MRTLFFAATQRDENKVLTQPRDVGGSAEAGVDWAASSFTDKAIRMAFIRKVYAILTVQLLVTVAFVAFFLLQCVNFQQTPNIGLNFTSCDCFYVV